MGDATEGKRRRRRAGKEIGKEGGGEKGRPRMEKMAKSRDCLFPLSLRCEPFGNQLCAGVRSQVKIVQRKCELCSKKRMDLQFNEKRRDSTRNEETSYGIFENGASL